MDFKIPLFNDIWMDNALVNFYSLLLEYNEGKLNIELNNDNLSIFGDSEDFKKILIGIVKNSKDYTHINLIEGDEKKEYKKDFILIQSFRVNELGQRDNKNGRFISFKPKLFSNPEEEISKIMESNKKGKRTCVFCGNSFSKKYDDIKQANYPFATKIKSLGGVRSNNKGEYKLKFYNDSACPMCNLIGILGWVTNKIIYRSIPNDKSYIFLPKSDNLIELNDFKEDYCPLLNNYERWSNIKDFVSEEGVVNTYGKFSTLLCFYHKFFIIVEDNDYNIDWGIISIPEGSVKNIQLLNYHVDKKILNIIKTFVQKYDEEIYILFNSILVLGDNDLTNTIRENLAKAFLTDNFRDFSRNFVINKQNKFIFSSKKIDFFKYMNLLIELWRMKKMGITEENLGTIRSVGNIISTVSKENLSLYYKLDKVKNIEQFWSCLREISKKLTNPKINRKLIRETSLDELCVLLKKNESNWKEIRDLLIIYSSMYYSISRGKSENNNSNENS